MKAKRPEEYLMFSKQYSVESIVDMISKLSICIYHEKDKKGFFFKLKVTPYKSILIPQTWLIDLLYSEISNGGYSVNKMDSHSLLKLLVLFNNYQCGLSHNKNTIALHIFGSFGEQKMFQELDVGVKFSREKYILENVSARVDDGIDFCKEFYEETGIDTTTFSRILVMFLCYYTMVSNTITYEALNEIATYMSVSDKMVLNVMNRISCSYKEIIDSMLLKSHPIIRCSISSNSHDTARYALHII